MRILNFLMLVFFCHSALAGVSVSFHGEITQRSLSQLQEKIEKAALKLRNDEERVVILDLNSGGGNLYATLSFLDSIRIKASKLNITLQTRVKSACESSCTVLFTVGEKRMAGKRSKFGFHSPDVVSRLPRGLRRSDIIEEARDRWLIAVAKVDPALAIEIESRALLLDPEMSYLSGKDLMSGYVTELVK